MYIHIIYIYIYIYICRCICNEIYIYIHMCLCVLHLDGSKNLWSANATSFLLLEQNHIQSRDVSSFGNEVLQNLLELTLPVLQFAASYYIYIYYIYSYAYFRRNKVYASWKLYKTPISVNHGSHFQVRFVWQVWDGQLSPSFKYIRF